jgi:hypothetical protein
MHELYLPFPRQYPFCLQLLGFFQVFFLANINLLDAQAEVTVDTPA